MLFFVLSMFFCIRTFTAKLVLKIGFYVQFVFRSPLFHSVYTGPLKNPLRVGIQTKSQLCLYQIIIKPKHLINPLNLTTLLTLRQGHGFLVKKGKYVKKAQQFIVACDKIIQ